MVYPRKRSGRERRRRLRQNWGSMGHLLSVFEGLEHLIQAHLSNPDPRGKICDLVRALEGAPIHF